MPINDLEKLPLPEEVKRLLRDGIFSLYEADGIYFIVTDKNFFFKVLSTGAERVHTLPDKRKKILCGVDLSPFNRMTSNG